MVDGDDDFGLMVPDRCREIPAQLESFDHQPVRMIEKIENGHTHRSTAGFLFAGSLANRLLRIQRSDARFATSDQILLCLSSRDFGARSGPFGNRARGPVLHVVRVRNDLSVHHEQILVPVVLRTWDVANIE